MSTKRDAAGQSLQHLPLPSGTFRAIYADPPWKFKTRGKNGDGRSASQHYPTLTLAQIKAIPVADVCTQQTSLFLWTTWPHKDEAEDLAKTWGFKYASLFLVWIKTPPGTVEGHAPPDWKLPRGTGYWTRGNSEPLFRFTRGAPGLPRSQPNGKGHAIPNVIFSPIREHSRKPNRARHIVRMMTYGPRLEMFARQRDEDFTPWGNEIDKFDAASSTAPRRRRSSTWRSDDVEGLWRGVVD